MNRLYSSSSSILILVLVLFRQIIIHPGRIQGIVATLAPSKVGFFIAIIRAFSHHFPCFGRFLEHLRSLFLALQWTHFRPLSLLSLLFGLFGLFGLLPIPDDLQELPESEEVRLPLHFFEGAAAEVLAQLAPPQELGSNSIEIILA